MDFNLNTILDVITLLAIVVGVYRFVKDPDEKAKTEIELLKQRCKMSHKNIDNDIALIKNNHLEHIEKDISHLKQSQIKIRTILEERLPKKE